jgi:ketosteroid isomerase-like protein
MAHRVIIACAASAALLLGACGSEARLNAAADVSKAKRAVESVENQMLADFQARDAAKLTSHYSGDALVATPGRPVAKGTDAIQRINAQDLSDPNFKLSFKNERTDVADSGDLAFTQGTFNVTYTDVKSGKPLSGAGTYVTVFRKQPDGSWKAVADIATPNG